MTNCRNCGAVVIANACFYCGGISGLPINTTAGPIESTFAQEDELDQLDEHKRLPESRKACYL